MTGKDFEEAGMALPEPDGESLLMAEAALEWIQSHTKLSLPPEALPASAKVFVLKYVELMGQGVGVTSESLGGMSQSFASEGRDRQLRQLAASLLGAWMKPTGRVLPGQRRWNTWV